jgi:lysine-arginine-ornithine-binding protein
MARSRWTFVLPLLALMGGTALAEPLRIATEGAYPPFNMRNASGELVGLEVDLARELCKRMNRECEIVAQDWDGIIPALLAAKYDGIMATMSITEERKKKIAFSNPYLDVPAYFIGLAASGIDGTEATLKGKAVGVQRGTTHERYLQAKFAGVVEVRTYDTVENALIDLKAGRIDAMIANAATALGWMKAPDGGALAMLGGPLRDAAIFGPGVGVGLRQEDAALKAEFDKAIAAVIADGTLDAISAAYVPFSLRP